MGDDGIVLSDSERQVLAGLAEQIGDPWLARQFVGQDTPPPTPKRRFPGSTLSLLASAHASGWLGLLLLLGGATLAVTTFAHSAVLGAPLGLVLMGAGLWGLLGGQSDVIRRLEQRVPAPAPPPPRTPPAGL